jgi:N-carbamoyl-L-amino-acid hydrolase
MDTDIKVDSERMKNDILELGKIGATEEGGVSRPSFSQPDLEAREWLKDRIQSAGLELRVDGAGNIFGRMPGAGKTVMTGSHIDSVINGGKFDGPAGVLAGLECLRVIKAEKIPVTKPLEVAAFTDEEGNLIGDFLGSRAFTGTLVREALEKGLTQFGVPLDDILENTEFSLDSIMQAAADRPELEAFLELHIEQGQVLETEEKPIGIVDAIAGKNYWMCGFTGKAGHAGTTPLELRQDAFLGLADFALKGTQYVATQHYGSMITFGRVQLFPGTFSIVPGYAEFTLDFRSTSGETLEELKRDLMAMALDTAAIRGLTFKARTMDATEPVRATERLLALLKDTCEHLGFPYMTLSSGAGHDAQILASVTDSNMIFIPCVDGISHSPQENILWEDMEKGADLLLHALLQLAE